MPRTMPDIAQSDATILITIEDLIYQAMGTAEKNMVNFKLLQSILFILGRQLRLLGNLVEIRIDDYLDLDEKQKQSSDSSDDSKDKSKTDKEDKDRDKKKESAKDMFDKEGSAKERDDRGGLAKGSTLKTDNESVEIREKGRQERRTSKDKDGDRYKGAGKEKDGDRDKGEDRAGRDSRHGGQKDGDRGRTASGTSIEIKEVQRGASKVLKVERASTGPGAASRGTLKVVTQAQFDRLAQEVKDLQQKAGPIPPPTLPGNKQLRDDLAMGRASLTETMQAMQVSTRVEAAETAIARVAELLSSLAAAGALPKDIAGKAEGINASLEASTREAKSAGATSSVAPDKKALTQGKSVVVAEEPKFEWDAKRMSLVTPSTTMTETASQYPAAATSRTAPAELILTHPAMDEALRVLRAEMTNNMTTMTTRATEAAEVAKMKANALTEKVEVALGIHQRINVLTGLVADYAEQLAGFDVGLTSQLQGFQEMMGQLESDLAGGLNLLEHVNTNAETMAVLELKERYDSLVVNLDETLYNHQSLDIFQQKLSVDLQSLIEVVEMMREEKADRDEVEDGLRDKADISRLAGMLSEEHFALVRELLERRLDLCYEKFYKQDQVWMGALKDLWNIAETKADLLELLGFREEAQARLRDLLEKAQLCERMLGDPKAAALTRRLAKDAYCMTCQVPAVMVIEDHSMPPLLPAARPLPADHHQEKDFCFVYEQEKPEHVCLRWCGGSHTLLSPAIVREHAPKVLPYEGPFAKRYLGRGIDGKHYRMEDPMQPCEECRLNTPDETPPPSEPVGDEEGGGEDAKEKGGEDVKDGGEGGGDGGEGVRDGGERASGDFDAPDKSKNQFDEEDGADYGAQYGTEDGVEDETEDGTGDGAENRAEDGVKDGAEREHMLKSIGQIVHGRVTIVREEDAQRAAAKHSIEATRSATAAAAGDDEQPE